MNKKRISRFVALFVALVMTAMVIPSNAIFADDTPIRGLVPLPLEYTTTGGEFILKPSSIINVYGNTDEETDELYRTGVYLAEKFRQATGYDIFVAKNAYRPAESGLNDIILSTIGGDAAQGDEGYNITVKSTDIMVRAYTPEGVFRGIQTLRQLFPACIERDTIVTGVKWNAPCSVINDKPEYGYRSAELDVARSFYDVEQVKRHIDNLAQYKINNLHMHLADDQGWRIEIKGGYDGPFGYESYSALTEIGGTSYSTQSPGLAKGGYYTQEEFIEIVNYAAERYVEIVPEIDMPSHTNAALASLKFLNTGVGRNGGVNGNRNTNVNRPAGERTTLYGGGSVGWCCFDTNSEMTYEFLEDVIEQICAISPSPYFHLGADEASNVVNAADYKIFVDRVSKIVLDNGKFPMGWDEGYSGAKLDDKYKEAGAIAHFWGNPSNPNGNNLAAGMLSVVTPSNKAYLDMRYPASFTDFNNNLGQTWAGRISTSIAYNWDPTQYGPRSSILGVEAALWTEKIQTNDHLDYMMFPRIAAIAEVAWTPQAMRGYDDFNARVANHGERWGYQGIQYYKASDVAWADPTVIDDSVDRVALQTIVDKARLLNQEDYTANNWAQFAPVLANAKEVLIDENANQAQVDSACTLLTGAYSLLVGRLEAWKDNLLALINEADALVGSTEYNKTYGFIREYFDNALLGAKAVYADDSANEVAVIDVCLTLIDAIHYLAAAPADYAKLEILVELANGLDLTRYNIGVEAFTTALANAETVLADMFATQGEADTAYTALLKAITSMRYEVDKSKLQDLYDKVTGIDASLYTDETVVVFFAAFAYAETVLNNPYATQEEVDTSHDGLNTAKLNLVPKPTGAAKTPSPTDEAGASGTANAAKTPADSAAPAATAPKTGDCTAFIAILSLISMAGVVVLMGKRKKS